MPRYFLNSGDVATGATADTFTTLLALIVPDTAGYRCRLRRLKVTPASANPVDDNCRIQVKRIADVSAGTAGTKTAVAGSAIAKQDTDAADSVVSGGVSYTVEPTTYETRPIFEAGFNMRGGLDHRWTAEEAPMFLRDQLCGILGANQDNAALDLNILVEFETY